MSRPEPAAPRPSRLALAALAACVLAGATSCAERDRTPPIGGAPGDAPGAPLVRPEQYAHSLAALGVPGARRAFQVGSGSQVSTGDVAVAFTLEGGGPVRVSPVWFEADGVPVAHWWMANGRDSVVFEAAAAASGSAEQPALEASVRARVVRGDASALHLRFATVPDGPSFTPWDASDSTRFREAWDGDRAVRNGAVVARAGAGWTPEGPAPAAPALTDGLGPGALRARASGGPEFELWLPAYPRAPGADAAPRPHAEIVSEARRLWRGWLAKAAVLATGDSLVDAAYRAAIVTLVLGHERERGEWVPIGSPFQYRDVWLRDGARVIRALAVAGLGELARSDARTLVRFQRGSGLLLSQRGQLDGVGQGLWAFDQASGIPPDRDLARALLPAATRARAWLDGERESGRVRGLEPAGLLPPTDPGDAELVRAGLVGNDAWAIAGCEALARMAARAGDRAEAEAAARSAASHRRDFAAALERFGGGAIAPSWTGLGRDWGNLGLAYPTRALAADDPRVLATEAAARARRGAPGLVSYGAPDSLHTYLGHDLAMNALLRGEPAAALAMLDSLLAHSSSTLGQAEIVHARGGFGRNLPPHGTAAADLVDLVRGTLALEDGDTLRLAAGAPLAWWGAARLANAPTRWGLLELRLERPAPGRLRATWRGAGAPVRLRVPDGVRATSVRGGDARLRDGRWVIAGAADATIELDVTPQAGAPR